MEDSNLGLKPFWSYYGGKWRAAPHYPAPFYRTIVEPFAGAAGYAMRYPQMNVILVEKYPVIAEMWRWLIKASTADVLAVPLVQSLDDLPSNTEPGARALVGFSFNHATNAPRKRLSSGRIKLAAMGRRYEGWNEARRARTARQVSAIRHWQVIEGDYTAAPDIRATWFVDPPYEGRAGAHYVHSLVDYASLGQWCRSRQGQVMVCENEGAGWLPFKPFRVFKSSVHGTASREVLWVSEPVDTSSSLPLFAHSVQDVAP